MSPCMILGPMTLFWATCKNFLFLVGFALGLGFRFRACNIDPCDIQSLFDLFRDDVAHFTIFRRLSTSACMSVLITYSDPLRKDDINEYKFKGI
jgi:hypothetical protein